MTAPYSQDELEALLREPESDRVERKRSAADRSGIRRNVCAFANDLPGHGAPGVIFVGVEDDGRCAGSTGTPIASRSRVPAACTAG